MAKIFVEELVAIPGLYVENISIEIDESLFLLGIHMTALNASVKNFLFRFSFGTLLLCVLSGSFFWYFLLPRVSKYFQTLGPQDHDTLVRVPFGCTFS